jgi:hypothetical protein
MKSTIGLKSILRWERLLLFGRFGYVEMIKCLMIKLFHLTGYLQSYQYSLFVVTASAIGGSRPIYGGLCAFRSYGEGYFFPTWMTA